MKDIALSKTAQIREFWDRASCGEDLYLHGRDMSGFNGQAAARYALEPQITPFARFDDARGKSVLEIGVGLGSDHERFARAGADLHGIDLTPRAVANTASRFATFGLKSDLQVANAEQLPFDSDTFDMVYSWGVIHHADNTARCAAEILRVLKPGGRFAVMIYQRRSMVGYMLWLRYALGRGRPWMSLDDIYARYLESPNTKAYSLAEGRQLFAKAERVRVSSVLTHGDLLIGGAGQNHEGPILDLARKFWPRTAIRRFFPNHGLHMMIEGYKPEER